MRTKRMMAGVACAVLALLSSTIPAMAQDSEDAITATGTIASVVNITISTDSCDLEIVTSSTAGDHSCAPVTAEVKSNVSYDVRTCAIAGTDLGLDRLTYNPGSGFTAFTDCGSGTTPNWTTILTAQPATGISGASFDVTFQLHVEPTDPVGAFAYTVNFLVEAVS